jgi:hypothetical protein
LKQGFFKDIFGFVGFNNYPTNFEGNINHLLQLSRDKHYSFSINAFPLEKFPLFRLMSPRIRLAIISLLERVYLPGGNANKRGSYRIFAMLQILAMCRLNAYSFFVRHSYFSTTVLAPE